MRTEFWRGMLAGGVLGAIAGLVMYQRFDQNAMVDRLVKSKNQMMDNVREAAGDLMR